TAAWPSLAERAGAGRHVLRVVLPASRGEGAAGNDEAADPDADADAEVIATALAEAARTLEIALPAARLRGRRRIRRESAAPAFALDRDAATAAIRTAVGAVEGLAVVGEWIAGSGLDSVITDALAEAERVRQAVLWGSP